MGTGFTNEIRATITGCVEEDVETNNAEVIKAELRLLCAKYQLDLEWD